MLKWIITIAVISFALLAAAQDRFTGRLVYEISYKDLPDDQEGIQSQLPSKYTVITDGKSWRAESTTRTNGDMKQIYRYSSDSAFTLMQIGPDLIQTAVKMPKTAFRWVKANDGADKNTAGLDNHQLIIAIADGSKLNVWTTKEFKPIPHLFYNGLDGLPTIIETRENGLTVLYELVSYSVESIDATYFEVPEGYSLVAQKVFQSLLR